ncbi:MAG TPA: 50S ribosomal protein L10 [Rhabdochlamydiaceae bacterium]|nr:50S ribosomal protein L10 [Rhabdochlamydiaceae bacterium]
MIAEKQLLLDEIKDKIKQSKGFVLTRYQNMDPNLSSELRLKMTSTGGTYFVLGKRMLIKAAAAEGIPFERKDLEGHIGVVFLNAEDPVQTTKSIFQFSKEHEAVIEVLGGRFEGQLYSSKDVKALSELPSKDEMRAQFLGLLEAPLSQTLSTMEALLTSILYCLENKKS